MPALARKRHLAYIGLALLVMVAAGVLSGIGGSEAPATGKQRTKAQRAASAQNAVRHGPVGWDSYRRPDRLAEIGSAARTRQFSSFDRAEGNDDGFVGTYSCLRESEAGCVIAEHTGAGEIGSIWFTRDRGDVSATGTITIELDGKVVVSESLQDLVNGDAGAPFVHPLVANADQSSGGVYIKVPMPYRESMRITTEHNPLFYHVTYRQFADPQGITTFDPTEQATDVLAKLRAAGTADPKPAQPNSWTLDGQSDIAPGKSAVLAKTTGPGALTELAIRVPQLASATEPAARVTQSDDVLANARLRISFDGTRTVDAPLGEFFGSGLGLYPVRSLMFGIDPATKTMRSWWLMPYAESVKVELYNGSRTTINGVESATTFSDNQAWKERLDAGHVGHFRATSIRAEAAPGRDHMFMDTAGAGRILGVTHTIEGRVPQGKIRAYLEGDERLFVDGSSSPDMHGTGTEDFYEGGWYFNRGTFSTPMNGNPVHEQAGDGCPIDCTGLYRLMLAGGVDFSSSVRFGIQHGMADDADAIAGSTTYWYGGTTGRLAWTDNLDIGNAASERAHAYTSNDLGRVTRATSRFDGIDGLPEPLALDGRSTTEPVSFTVEVDEDNRGVTLRRISNAARAYQAARVTVDGVDAGLWTQPLGSQHRQWLDDFYQLPAKLTAGKRQLSLTLTPLDDAPPWNALAYQALSKTPPAPDTSAPARTTGLTASADRHTTVTLGWQAARDDIYAPQYEVYGSTTPGFTPGEDNRLGTSRSPGFVHNSSTVSETWYYRVRAVDRAGRTGPFSNETSATTGDTVRVEAEALVAAATATGHVQTQGNCCGVRWSKDAQLWFTPEGPGTVTAGFEIGTAGTYRITGIQRTASDYGTNVLHLDGRQIGASFDAFNSGQLQLSTRVDYGTRELTAGTHTLDLEVTGKNPASSGYLAGLDYLEFEPIDQTDRPVRLADH